MRILLLVLVMFTVWCEEGRLSTVDVMVKVVNHYVHLMPQYKKVTIDILGVTPSADFVRRLDMKGKEYLEYRDELENDVSVLKISIRGNRFDSEHEISVVEVSHRDSPLSGSVREYRYHWDSTGEVDRFVFISDRGVGIH